MIEKKLERGEYDLAFFRLSGEVPTERIKEMPLGQKALIAVETEATDIDRERIERYRNKVEAELEKEGINYSLEIKVLKFEDGKKLGLIITRI